RPAPSNPGRHFRFRYEDKGHAQIHPQRACRTGEASRPAAISIEPRSAGVEAETVARAAAHQRQSSRPSTMTNSEQVQDPLKMSLQELDDFLQSAIQAMKAEWAEPVKGFRHLMNTVLFLQLGAIRAHVEGGKIEPAIAAAFLRSDFGLGYVF